MSDRIENMNTFVVVAELGSFTRTAEHLSLPKATVSTQIQQLEASLGVRLLHRTTRQVQLTQDGQLFYERCKDLLADVQDVESMFLGSGARLSGRLRVDMGVGIARNLILPRLPAFMTQYPDIRIELSCTDRMVDPVHEGFDCVIRVGTPRDSSLIARPLGQMRMVNCASPDYLARYGIPQCIEDLSAHLLVEYVNTLGAKPTPFEYLHAGQVKWHAMPSVLTVNNADAYIAACRAGLGLIQVPVVGVRDDLLHGHLIEVLPAYVAPPMPVSCIYPHRRHLAKRVQVFMDWVQQQMTDYLAEPAH